MDLYEQYIKERENLDCIKTDRGFITYRINFPTCFVADCFVVEKNRHEKHATFLMNQVFEICKQAGVVDVYCQTDERANGYKIPVYAVLNFGFDLVEKDGPVSSYKMGVVKWVE